VNFRTRVCPIKRYDRRTRLSRECSFSVAGSSSRYPDRPEHHEARVSYEQSRPRLAVLRHRYCGASLASNYNLARRGKWQKPQHNRGEYRQAAKRATANTQGYSAAAKFGQPGRLNASGNVRRFAFNSGHSFAPQRTPLWATTGLMHRSKMCPYSITSSARVKNDSGIVNLSTFAVFKLNTSSNFVGCSTGISRGAIPRKILSTSSAARR